MLLSHQSGFQVLQLPPRVSDLDFYRRVDAQLARVVLHAMLHDPSNFHHVVGSNLLEETLTIESDWNKLITSGLPHRLTRHAFVEGSRRPPL